MIPSSPRPPAETRVALLGLVHKPCLRRDREIVEMGQAAYEAQGGVWNQEVFPAIRELKNCSSRRAKGNRGRRKGIQKIGRMVSLFTLPCASLQNQDARGSDLSSSIVIRAPPPQRLALFDHDMQIGILKQIKNTEAKTEERNGSPTSAAVLPARYRWSRCPCHRPHGRRGGGSPS